MALPNPPELRRLADFMASLPPCPHGCESGWVYNSPTFRVPTADDTIDDQVTEIIARYGREAARLLQRHLAKHHTADFFALLDEACAIRVAREAVHWAWLDEARPRIAEQLTATLPADLRAAGMRFEWEAER